MKSLKRLVAMALVLTIGVSSTVYAKDGESAVSGDTDYVYSTGSTGTHSGNLNHYLTTGLAFSIIQQEKGGYATYGYAPGGTEGDTGNSMKASQYKYVVLPSIDTVNIIQAAHDKDFQMSGSKKVGYENAMLSGRGSARWEMDDGVDAGSVPYDRVSQMISAADDASTAIRTSLGEINIGYLGYRIVLDLFLQTVDLFDKSSPTAYDPFNGVSGDVRSSIEAMAETDTYRVNLSRQPGLRSMEDRVGTYAAIYDAIKGQSGAVGFDKDDVLKYAAGMNSEFEYLVCIEYMHVFKIWDGLVEGPGVEKDAFHAEPITLMVTNTGAMRQIAPIAGATDVASGWYGTEPGEPLDGYDDLLKTYKDNDNGYYQQMVNLIDEVIPGEKTNNWQYLLSRHLFGSKFRSNSQFGLAMSYNRVAKDGSGDDPRVWDAEFVENSQSKRSVDTIDYKVNFMILDSIMPTKTKLSNGDHKVFAEPTNITVGYDGVSKTSVDTLIGAGSEGNKGVNIGPSAVFGISFGDDTDDPMTEASEELVSNLDNTMLTHLMDGTIEDMRIELSVSATGRGEWTIGGGYSSVTNMPELPVAMGGTSGTVDIPISGSISNADQYHSMRDQIFMQDKILGYVKSDAALFNNTKYDHGRLEQYYVDTTAKLIFTVDGEDVNEFGDPYEVDLLTDDALVNITIEAPPPKDEPWKIAYIPLVYHNIDSLKGYMEIKEGEFTQDRSGESWDSMQGVPSVLQEGIRVSNQTHYLNAGGTAFYVFVSAYYHPLIDWSRTYEGVEEWVCAGHRDVSYETITNDKGEEEEKEIVNEWSHNKGSTTVTRSLIYTGSFISLDDIWIQTLSDAMYSAPELLETDDPIVFSGDMPKVLVSKDFENYVANFKTEGLTYGDPTEVFNYGFTDGLDFISCPTLTLTCTNDTSPRYTNVDKVIAEDETMAFIQNDTAGFSVGDNVYRITERQYQEEPMRLLEEYGTVTYSGDFNGPFVDLSDEDLEALINGGDSSGGSTTTLNPWSQITLSTKGEGPNADSPYTGINGVPDETIMNGDLDALEKETPESYWSINPAIVQEKGTGNFVKNLQYGLTVKVRINLPNYYLTGHGNESLFGNGTGTDASVKNSSVKYATGMTDYTPSYDGTRVNTDYPTLEYTTLSPELKPNGKGGLVEVPVAATLISGDYVDLVVIDDYTASMYYDFVTAYSRTNITDLRAFTTDLNYMDSWGVGEEKDLAVDNEFVIDGVGIDYYVEPLAIKSNLEIASEDAVKFKYKGREYGTTPVDDLNEDGVVENTILPDTGAYNLNLTLDRSKFNGTFDTYNVMANEAIIDPSENNIELAAMRAAVTEHDEAAAFEVINDYLYVNIDDGGYGSIESNTGLSVSEEGSDRQDNPFNGLGNSESEADGNGYWNVVNEYNSSTEVSEITNWGETTQSNTELVSDVGKITLSNPNPDGAYANNVKQIEAIMGVSLREIVEEDFLPPTWDEIDVVGYTGKPTAPNRNVAFSGGGKETPFYFEDVPIDPYAKNGSYAPEYSYVAYNNSLSIMGDSIPLSIYGNVLGENPGLNVHPSGESSYHTLDAGYTGSGYANPVIIHNPIGMEGVYISDNDDLNDQRVDQTTHEPIGESHNETRLYIGESFNVSVPHSGSYGTALDGTIAEIQPRGLVALRSDTDRGKGWVGDTMWENGGVNNQDGNATGQGALSTSLYTDTKSVMFPFDVWYHTNGGQQFVSANSWVTLYDADGKYTTQALNGAIPSSFTFTPAMSCDDMDNATVYFKTTSINEGSGEQVMTNSSRSGRVAADTVVFEQQVDLIGRIGNIIVDDTNDPRWSDTFFNGIVDDWLLPGTTLKSDVTQPTGFLSSLMNIYNYELLNGASLFNVQNSKTANLLADIYNRGNNLISGSWLYPDGYGTLPLDKYDHPSKALADDIKLGYDVQFSIQTIGSYGGEDSEGMDLQTRWFLMDLSPTTQEHSVETEIPTMYRLIGDKYYKFYDFDDETVSADNYPVSHTLTHAREKISSDEVIRYPIEDNAEYQTGTLNNLLIPKEGITSSDENGGSGYTGVERWHARVGLPATTLVNVTDEQDGFIRPSTDYDGDGEAENYGILMTIEPYVSSDTAPWGLTLVTEDHRANIYEYTDKDGDGDGDITGGTPDEGGTDIMDIDLIPIIIYPINETSQSDAVQSGNN